MLQAELRVMCSNQIPSRTLTSSASAMVYLEEFPKWKVSDLSALGVPFQRMVAEAPTLPLCSEPSVYTVHLLIMYNDGRRYFPMHYKIYSLR